MIRNVILDWSGTLVDDLPAVLEATNQVFRQAGLPELSRERFREEFCLPFERFYTRRLPGVSLPQLEAWFHPAFEQVQDQVTALPFARSFLEFCRRNGWRTFVLSSVHARHYTRQAAGLGFDALIEHAYVQIPDKTAKIRDVLAAHGLAPRETLFVGDMAHDLEAARHGGTWSCAVLTGYNQAHQLKACGPDLIVEHLGELQAILEQRGFDLDSAGGRSPGAVVPTVGALIYNADNEVLLVRTRKWSDRWGIPGGKIKYGETAEDALRRELAEETGLAVREIRFVLAQDCISSAEFYREAHFLLLNYTCRCESSGPVVLNEEAQAFRWVDVGTAMQMDLNQPTRRLIEAVRAHGRPE